MKDEANSDATSTDTSAINSDAAAAATIETNSDVDTAATIETNSDVATTGKSETSRDAASASKNEISSNSGTASTSASKAGGADPAASVASLREAQQWSSIVLHHDMRLEHAAVDIDTDRLLYHLELELASPLPSALLAHAEYLCLSWHYGGIWKIVKLSENNRVVHCQSWRTTDLNHHEVNEIARKVEESQREATEGMMSMAPATTPDAEELPPCLFEWKMQLGKWGENDAHWFLRDIRPPSPSTGDGKDGVTTSLMSDEETLALPMVAQLLAGFTPLEVEVEINSITTVETVGQTFSADVTWQVTMPALSSIREDSVIRELLDILELDTSQFEFTNINSTQEERDMTTSLSFAGLVEFSDPTVAANDPHALATHRMDEVNHLQFSRRVIAVFSEEMSLYSFPFDQQKLTLNFSTGGGVRASLKITPASVDAGSFAIEKYKLGNIFDAVFQDKVFVCGVSDAGEEKGMTFAIMLERKSAYYMTNVGIPSACITYLCFISYAPLSDGGLMDTDARLQIVLTLLLTAVTFKNEVASLIPQVSYFTTLDKYVFFCFVVTCIVTLENSLFPVFEAWSGSTWSEDGLLGFSFGAFTLVNLVWGLYIAYFVRRRRYASHVLLQVQELTRIVSAEIPREYREAVLLKFLERADFPKWAIPPLMVAHSGDVFVQLPDYSPHDTRAKATREQKHAASRHISDEKRGKLQEIFRELNPTAPLPTRPSSSRIIRAARPKALDTGEGRHAPRKRSIVPEPGVGSVVGGVARPRTRSSA